MIQETSVLIFLVIVMLVASYLSGSIPLVMRLSEEKLKFVTVLGAGLLVGTALTVIIPEGIRSIYFESKRPYSNIISDNVADGNKPQDFSKIIGISLILGFIFMMLVDQISQRRNNNGFEGDITITLGLVVHAAADGIALGAAATTSHHDVEIIVFLAIMLHKAPAAFGLVSFLLHEKFERQRIRKHLIIFSLSAPLLTLLTYFGIGQEQKDTLNSVNATGIALLFSAGTFLYVATVHVLPELTHRGNHQQIELSQNYHLLEQSLLNNSNEVFENCTAQFQTHGKGLSYSELLIISCGALLPLILTFSHHH